MPDKIVFNVKVINSREVRKPGDVARIGAMKNYAELWWGTSEGKKPLKDLDLYRRMTVNYT